MPETEQKDTLLAKLDGIEERYCQIERQIADPAIAADTAKVVPLAKEQGRLRNIVTKYREYKKIAGQLEEARRILEDSAAEEELKEMAKEEVEQLGPKQNALLEEIQNTLVTADDDAIDSVIMEIRAGTGGEEAALFARDLYDMYVKYADSRKWKAELLDFSPTDKGGFREVIFSVKGPGVWSELGYEGIHTSAATVAVLPEPEEIDIQINPNDVVEHVSRAGGPGGQNVNKVSSAIRLEHVPTGITVNMREDKSQHKNRAKAWRLLRSRLYEHYQGQKRAERDSKRKTMIGSGDRSEKIRTYNFPQNRLTDHRINLSVYTLDKIMTGDMSDLIAALKKYDIEQRLKSL
jgi:peptide chain release factor 1